MINNLTTINWISVGIAFIIYFILGGLWFTLLFKNSYAISLNKVGQLPEKPAPIFIVGPAICTLFITVATALLVYALKVSTLGGAIELALVVGIGYLVANTLNIAINPNIPKPILYGIISGTYHLTGIIFVCVVLVLMKH